MTKDEVIHFLQTANTARKGSFGEFVFAHVGRAYWGQIVSVHRDNVDFLLDGQPADVKTTAVGILIDEAPLVLKDTAPGVLCAIVDFSSAGARISLAGRILSRLDWGTVVIMYEQWHKRMKKQYPRRDISTAGGPTLAENDRQLADIKAKVRRIFLEHNLPHQERGNPRLRIIKRTVQSGFGKESPHNLLPKHWFEKDWTVFLDFRNRRIAEDNLNRIYAFPNAIGVSFPLLEKSNLHLPKIDCSKIPVDFIFTGLDDLRERLGCASASVKEK